jgi:23S rRNA-/tRNA-specific pseudouridylate synthase
MKTIMPFTVIYEDGNIIAVSKAPGISESTEKVQRKAGFF